MTIIDFFLTWPLLVRIVTGGMLLIWFIESFLTPFKINLTLHTLKRIETLLEQIKGKIEANKEIEVDYQKMVSLLQTILGKNKNAL